MNDLYEKFYDEIIEENDHKNDEIIEPYSEHGNGNGNGNAYENERLWARERGLKWNREQ